MIDLHMLYQRVRPFKTINWSDHHRQTCCLLCRVVCVDMTLLACRCAPADAVAERNSSGSRHRFRRKCFAFVCVTMFVLREQCLEGPALC
jgi:hypothetical protein